MNSKIEIKLNDFAFSCEGEEKWVTEQLDKILGRLKELQELSKKGGKNKDGSAIEGENEIGKLPLATYLRSKNATTNQIRKFLAVAAWLHSKGSKRISTSDITKNLRENNQQRLTNATECLNNNVRKGFCEKEGGQFFVTEDGYNELK
jgi:hypothetical protein